MARIIQTADLQPYQQFDQDTQDWIYNGLDCCLTEEILRATLPQLDDVTTPTYEFSKSLQAPILEMMMRGVLVNQNTKFRIMQKFEKQLAQLEHQLDRIVQEGIGVTLNWRSPKQLGQLLYDVMQLPEQKKRNTNGIWARTTDREALENLEQYFIAEPIVHHLLLLRDIGKALGFLRTGIDPDGRMRTNFNIAGTNTGRLASSMSDYGTGTNLQNVSRDLRQVFCADPGWKFANLDLEQADSRNLGALCWELFVDALGPEEAGKYLDACEGGDLHTFVCKMCNPQLPWGEGSDRDIADTIFYRDKSYRDGSKVLGHGSNYLGTPPTMAKHTKFPRHLIEAFQRSYFGAFPAIPRYHDYVRGQLKDFAFLTTLFGRRRFFFGRPDNAATVREAVAYGPQSMTADEIDTGILKLWRANRVQLLIQVHDSILFQYREEEEDEILPWALETLKAPLVLKHGRDFVVPTEAKVGWNWGDRSDWTERDFLAGKCKESDVGTCKENPDGLKKWKGSDKRKRVDRETRISILAM